MLTTFIQIAQFGKGLQPATGAYSELSQTDEKIKGVPAALYNLESFISNMIGIATIAASIFFIVYFLLGALSWISSEGDSTKIKKARDQMMNGAIGLIIVIGMYAVVGLIGTLLGIEILRPAQELTKLIPGYTS